MAMQKKHALAIRTNEAIDQAIVPVDVLEMLGDAEKTAILQKITTIGQLTGELERRKLKSANLKKKIAKNQDFIELKENKQMEKAIARKLQELAHGYNALHDVFITPKLKQQQLEASNAG